MSAELDSTKDSHLPKFERKHQILVKLSYRDSCNSKLSGLRPVGNMALS